MPAAIATPPAPLKQPGAAPAKGTVAPPDPFTRAAHEHWELCAMDVSTQLDANSHGPISLDVPASGYLRSVLVRVTASGGTGGGAVARPDAPWSVIQSMDLSDVSGSPLIDTLPGYIHSLINMFGGYAFYSDLTKLASYTPMDVNGNFEFVLRLPVEVSAREGLGSLPNMNAKQIFRSKIRQAAATDLYATPPAGLLPVVRFTATMEGWTAPVSGEAPPALGTVQQWSAQTYNFNGGSQRIGLERVGNSIRNLILIARDDNGVRQDALLPDDLTVKLDQRLENVQPRVIRRHLLSERYGLPPASFPAGVDVLDYTHDFDGHPGGEMRDLWVQTTSASRYELIGTWGGSGTLTVVTNEIIVPATGIA